jgi:hypothetical protein
MITLREGGRRMENASENATGGEHAAGRRP